MGCPVEQTLVELSHRVAELEATVQLLAILVGVLGAVIVTAAVAAAMWLRSRHSEVMGGIEGLARGHEELVGEVRMAELRGAQRHDGVLVH